ncbi:MAG TPA: hypothetical protein VJR05_15500 [Acidimicrobiia bacterium]|nr:hypothetical protein [Acidimicrobiia bacterium]
MERIDMALLVTGSRSSSSSPAARRQQVRRLPWTATLVEVGDLHLDLDPLEILADLDPGLLPPPEGRLRPWSPSAKSTA